MRHNASLIAAPFAALAPAERTAIWALRRVVYDAQWRTACAAPAASPSWSLAGDLARMAGTFASVFALRERSGLRRLQVNPPGSLALTKDERRLLNAVAASQADDGGLADNYLFKVVADRDLRRRLADAVMTLAAALAVQGHWLPLRTDSVPPPAVARHAMTRRAGAQDGYRHA